MARIVNEKEHTMRLNEILNVAQRLVYTKGYEKVTIQDVIIELHISKGAFYHYFDSKQALLEAMIERMQREAELLLIPIVHDPDLPALEKLQKFFDTLARWKPAQKTFFLALLRVWYTDDNVIVRDKMRSIGAKRFTLLLSSIIRQGTQEGVFATPFPDQVGEVILSIMLGLSESVATSLLSSGPNGDTLKRLESTIAAYNNALECVLRAPAGSFSFVDAETLKEWVVPPSDNANSTVLEVEI